METFFEPDFFTRNRAELRRAIGSDTLVVVTANGVMQRGGDEPSPFYQDSNFWYLTGLNGADLVLVMDAREAYVIVPTLSAVRVAFDGAHDLEAYANRSGISSFLAERGGWQKLREQLQAADEVATLFNPPVRLRGHGIHTLPFRRQLIARLKRANTRLRLRDIRPELSGLRVVKQPEELKALKAAITITTDTLQALVTGEQFAAATHEYQLEAMLTYQFRKRGSEGHAFAPIVGAGQHSTTLHHIENNGTVAPDDLIVLDVGASVEHYSADVTRTVSRQPLSGRKAEVFKAVEAVQDYALSLMKPGALYKEYEQAVETYMGEQLQWLGLVHDATHEQIRRYYPHATSHFLGLDTHDVGDYRQAWQPGMVLTCEPGIYIPEEGIGVRIEDDILINETGHESLSGACPRRLTSVK